MELSGGPVGPARNVLNLASFSDFPTGSTVRLLVALSVL